MLDVFTWLGYILLYLFNPDEIASDVIDSFHVSWWVHELLLFVHHALIVAGEAILVIIAVRHPKLFVALWRGIRWLWYWIRQALRWVGKRLGFRIRTGSLTNRPHAPGNGKRLTRTDIFWTGATPYLAKLASVAVVLQWRQFGWSGFTAAWLGGCLRIMAYPFLGKWVYLIIAVYALIRWRRYLVWLYQWLRSWVERVAL